MPLIPAHQGLIAPLWRRWPHRFDVLALCVGALTPDAVDGITSIIIRGHLGQWYGHTLIGMHTMCVPFGFVLVWATLHLGRFLTARESSPAPSRSERFGAWLLSLYTPPVQAGRRVRFAFILVSLWVGAFSHLFFDFISHGNFRWFYPWYDNPHFFPEWWYIRWFEISPPGYTDYPIGPHFLAWLFLSLLGLAMLFRSPKRRNKPAPETSPQ